MNAFIRLTTRYILDTIGADVELRPWRPAKALPPYLCDRYQFLRMKLMDIECVVMVDRAREEQTPAVIAKHLDQVRARCEAEVIYARDAVTSYNRRRLIDQKVPFIVPGNQMYLPMLGMDLRAHLKGLREKKQVLSPSAQALVLQILWKKETVTLTPLEAARRMGYSAMTMSRAFDELEAAGIGEHSVKGKERRLQITETGKPLWEKALPHLASPVRKRIHVDPSVRMEDGALAGLSALARYTMLAEPDLPVFAFLTGEWKIRAKEAGIVARPFPEPGGAEIELWKYAPARFAHEGAVDRLSLYLSLKDNPDERLQAALDTLLEGMEW